MSSAHTFFMASLCADKGHHRVDGRPSPCIKSFRYRVSCLYQFLLLRADSICFHIFYFIALSLVGFLALKLLKVRNPLDEPRNIDMFFTSVSAATVSSMSTVEMETFSNSQLVVMIILMIVGGEVFTSMIGLVFQRLQLKQRGMIENQAINPCSSPPLDNLDPQIELGSITPDLEHSASRVQPSRSKDLMSNSIWYLTCTVMAYFLAINVGGSISILLYTYIVPSARGVLRRKGIQIPTFSVFTTVSSFSSCGFLPTNENMIVFKKNSGLQLLIIPQVLLGNTLFPSSLRFLIWVLKRVTRRPEFGYILQNTREIGYYHLFPYLHSLLLALTVLGFALTQLILICAMEWHSEALSGMNSYQKLVGVLFLSVNSRHTGESIVDLSILSSAILVLFVVMMYLPPYTTFLPFKDEDITSRNHGDEKTMGLLKSLAMSQLSCLAIFVILICITERKKLKEDPLNFNVLNIVVEVVSAYGNVGFSTGYSCERRLNPDGNCKDAWYGFAGAWSDKGKLILILVMFFGRLKKFSMHAGKAWKLS